MPSKAKSKKKVKNTAASIKNRFLKFWSELMSFCRKKKRKPKAK